MGASLLALAKSIYYYYGDIAPLGKGEIADSILYLTQDVFFEVFDYWG